MSNVLITGASGQCAIEMSHYLLNKGHRVYATIRRVARPQSRHVTELLNNPNYSLLELDLTDMSSIIAAVKTANPTYFINLAAQSHVGASFKEPLSTIQITGHGVANCLEVLRKISPHTRFITASSSEMFGGLLTNEGYVTDIKSIDGCEYLTADEDTPLVPRSPYGAAKVLAHNLTRIYRESYGLFASTFIAFNYEGIYRKPEFVTRKVTIAVNKILKNRQSNLELGTLNFARDWSNSKDVVDGIWKIINYHQPEDFVLSSGEMHTAHQLLDEAFGYVGLNWHDYVIINKNFARPNDVIALCGDSFKARTMLGWSPKYSFRRTIREMVENDANILATYGDILE